MVARRGFRTWRLPGTCLLHARRFGFYLKEQISDSSPENQSLGALLTRAQSGETLKMGRAIVRPERYNSTWAYYSTEAEKHPVYLAEQDDKPHYLTRKEILTNAFLRFSNLEYVSSRWAEITGNI